MTVLPLRPDFSRATRTMPSRGGSLRRRSRWARLVAQVAVAGRVHEAAVRHRRIVVRRPLRKRCNPVRHGVRSAGRTGEFGGQSRVPSELESLQRRWSRCSVRRSSSAPRLADGDRRAGRAVRALGRLPREPHDQRRLRRRDARRHAQRRRAGDRARLVHAALRGQRRRRGARLRPARAGRLAPGRPLLRRGAVGDAPRDASCRARPTPGATSSSRTRCSRSARRRRASGLPAASSAGGGGSTKASSTKTSTSKDIVGSQHVSVPRHAERQRQHDGQADASSTWARRSARSRPAATRSRCSTRPRRRRSTSSGSARRATKVSSARFVGKHTVTLTLKAGPVVLLRGTPGKKTYFIVHN